MTCSLKMKPWKFGHLLALIFPAYLCGYCNAVEFRPCVHAVKNEPCNMTCLVPDFSKLIEFKCNGSTRGSCSVFVCPSNMIQEGVNTMYFQIPSLSYTNDNCEWTCSHGGSSSPGSNITIYSGYSITPSLTSQQNADVVNLTATAECLYPSNPNVVVQYKEQGGQFLSLSQQAVELQSSNGQGGCSFDIENRITAISDVSGRLTGLGGKSVFFRMKFMQYSDAIPAYTNDEGPFYFNISSSESEGCKYSDAELFLGGFSCFLIVFGITSIIMLIFLLCQMLPKIFEDKKSNKIIIIVVFNSFALIFGFALGFGLKECEKRDLGLGLGLGFGFILAIALFLTLYIYHKQCGSKKENEDENRESPPKFNSKKPEDSPKRVGNKTDVLKGDQSALNQKVLHSPLPLPPVDNSQTSKASDDKLSRKKLDPIAVENEEANSSEKKKKKKKRKKKKIDNETADNNVEEAGDNGNLN